MFAARQRALKIKQKHEGNHTVPFDNASYEDTSAQLFNLSRALSRNPSGADLKLRCTEFDANGSVTLVAGEFKKSELIAKYGLQPRDLRKIDSSVLPHILVRPSAILINLLHLRVLIQSDRVLVFDAYGSTDSYTQSLFMYDLEGKLRQKADPRSPSGSATYLPYEFRALEAVLISVTGGLEAEFALVRDPVTHILRELEEDIDREKLRHLLIHSKKLGTFEQKARLVRDAIDDLLNADDDLAAMYLTQRQNAGQPREENDHQEVEMLLESYHKICDEIVEISGNLISNIRNTEEVVKAILDANRNQLMLLEIKFSIGTLGLAGGTLIAGLYGMNLNNFIEETDWGFGAVSAVCFGLSAVVAMYGMRKLRKVQKVRMWGEGGPDSSYASSHGHSGVEGSRNGGGYLSRYYQQHHHQQHHHQQHAAAHGAGGRSAWSRGNWRSEALESAAIRSARAQERERVLWPGMEGLGMHRLPEDVPAQQAREEDVDEGEERRREQAKLVRVPGAGKKK
jgi:magnesium transporter